MFLDRVAALGHVERSSLSIDYLFADGFAKNFDNEFEVAPPEVALVADSLICAINANLNLTHLDLGETWHFLDWGPHLPNIAMAMETHEALRTFVVEGDNGGDETEGPFQSGYSWLERLISHNQNKWIDDRQSLFVESRLPCISNSVERACNDAIIAGGNGVGRMRFGGFPVCRAVAIKPHRHAV